MNYYNWLFFSFKGRVNRGTYWLFQVVMIAVATVLLLTFGGDIMARLSANPEDQQAFNDLLGLASKINLALLWPKLAVDVKRFQDRDKAWYWVLIQLIPLIGPLWYLLEAGFMPGTQGSNRFGSGPGPHSTQPAEKQSNDDSHFEA